MLTNNDGLAVCIIVYAAGVGFWAVVYLVGRGREKKRGALAEEEKLDASAKREVTIAKIKEFKVRRAKRKS